MLSWLSTATTMHNTHSTTMYMYNVCPYRTGRGSLVSGSGVRDCWCMLLPLTIEWRSVYPWHQWCGWSLVSWRSSVRSRSKAAQPFSWKMADCFECIPFGILHVVHEHTPSGTAQCPFWMCILPLPVSFSVSCILLYPVTSAVYCVYIHMYVHVHVNTQNQGKDERSHLFSNRLTCIYIYMDKYNTYVYM